MLARRVERAKLQEKSFALKALCCLFLDEDFMAVLQTGFRKFNFLATCTMDLSGKQACEDCCYFPTAKHNLLSGSIGNFEGNTPFNDLYEEALPEGVPFSGFRYIKSRDFTC